MDEGSKAPDFTLTGVSGDGQLKNYPLDSLLDGAALLIGIYPYDFSPICGRQICEIDDLEWLTFEDNLNVVGIGGDGPYAHQRFIEERDISYPLLSDYAKNVSEAYGVLNEEKDGVERVPQRSIFLVSPGRRIEYRWVADDNWTEWEMTPLDVVKERFDELDIGV